MFAKLKQKAQQLKTQTEVLVMAYSDKRTPVSAKIIIGITVGYLLSPIDLIPDFIPVLGLLDDIIIVPALITLSIKLIPPVVLDDARKKIKDNSQATQKRNWIVAVIIILIWLAILYYIFRVAKSLWN